MYNLKDVWLQAESDPMAVKQKYGNHETITGVGVKLQMFSDRIEIFNLSKGGNYYKECDEAEYECFYSYGWKEGKIRLAIMNCLFKLNLIEQKIKTEVNTRKNDKHIQNLKNRRESILNKYTKHKQKLNQLN